MSATNVPLTKAIRERIAKTGEHWNQAEAAVLKKNPGLAKAPRGKA